MACLQLCCFPDTELEPCWINVSLTSQTFICSGDVKEENTAHLAWSFTLLHLNGLLSAQRCFVFNVPVEGVRVMYAGLRLGGRTVRGGTPDCWCDFRDDTVSCYVAGRELWKENYCYIIYSTERAVWTFRIWFICFSYVQKWVVLSFTQLKNDKRDD